MQDRFKSDIAEKQQVHTYVVDFLNTQIIIFDNSSSQIKGLTLNLNSHKKIKEQSKTEIYSYSH